MNKGSAVCIVICCPHSADCITGDVQINIQQCDSEEKSLIEVLGEIQWKSIDCITVHCINGIAEAPIFSQMCLLCNLVQCSGLESIAVERLTGRQILAKLPGEAWAASPDK